MFYLIAIIILSLHNRLIYGITCKGEYDAIIHKEVSNYDYGSIPGAYVIKKPIPRKNVDFFVGILPPADKLEDGKDKDNSWNWSNRALADSESIIGKTFEKVYSDPDQYNFIQYSISEGSGALVWSERNKENAVWFISSASYYLNSFFEKTYRPHTSRKASNFMCLNIKLKNVRKIYHHLKAAEIIYYDRNFKLEYFKTAINRKPKIKDTSSNHGTVEKSITRNGVAKSILLRDKTPDDPRKLFILSTVLKETVVIVTRSKSDRGPFWKKVSETIGVPELYVKSNSIPSYAAISKRSCENNISNVLETKFMEKNGHSLNWKIEPEFDQSNWGICGKEMDCYFTSDINNTIAGSEKTNGMAVCIFNSNLHKAFKDSIKRLACEK